MKHFKMVFLAFFAGLLVACGANNVTQTPPTPSGPGNTFAFTGRTTTVPGVGTQMSFGKTAKSSGFDWSLVPKANAQTTSAPLVITGPSNGFCTGQPAVNTNPPTTPFLYVPYGAGELGDPSCTQGQVLDKALFVANTTDAIDIVGDGTLQGLLVKVGAGSGQGVTAEVWVKNVSGSAVQTPLTCTIPAGSGEARCEDTTNSFVVHDNEKAVLILSGNPGDTYTNIRWVLGKN